jgi:hypothetical protein
LLVLLLLFFAPGDVVVAADNAGLLYRVGNDKMLIGPSLLILN